MFFYFNASGVPLSMIHERVFQGSNRVNKIYFACPIFNGNLVNVAFTLPDGSSLPQQLMTLNENQELKGVFDEKGKTFSIWEYDIPSIVTILPGTVTVQFYITSSQGELTATAGVQFNVEKGVPVIEPEKGDSYQEVLDFLADNNIKSQVLQEEVEKLKITADKSVVKTEIGNMIYGTDENGEQKEYAISEYSNKINVIETSDNENVLVCGNNEYYFKTLNSLNITLVDGKMEGQMFYLTFKNGETPCVFNLTGNFEVVEQITTFANTIVEISGVWNGDKWNIAWRQL